MKTNILLVCISIFLLQSCGMSELKRKEKEEKAKKFMEENRAYLAQDSINAIDQHKAIGDIMFGISESDYTKKEVIFLSKCKPTNNEIYTIKYRSLSKPIEHKINYKIGEYGFMYSFGLFYHDSLYSVCFKGFPINIDNDSTLMRNQFDALLSILTEKYGDPIINTKSIYGFQKRTSLVKDDTVDLCIWYVKKKNIKIQIDFDGEFAFLWLIVYLPEIDKKAEEQNKQERLKYELERKKRDLQKAREGADLL